MPVKNKLTSKRKTKRKPKRKTKKKIETISKTECKKKLQRKIKKNIKEDIFVSRSQAVAVAYSQINKKYPYCKRFFKRGGCRKNCWDINYD